MPFVQFTQPINRSLDSLLSDFSWAPERDEEGRVIITYGFARSLDQLLIDSQVGYDVNSSVWDLPYRRDSIELPRSAQDQAVLLFEALSNSLNVTFKPIDDPTEAVLVFGLTNLAREGEQSLSFGPSPDLFPFEVEYGQWYDAAGTAGDVWLDASVPDDKIGEVLLESVGRALGLSAPNENGFAVTRLEELAALPEAQDYVRYTVMSENDSPSSAGSNVTSGEARTFMPLDLEALTYLYGVSADRSDSLYVVNDAVDNVIPVDNLGFPDKFESYSYLNGYVTIDDADGYNALIVNVDADLSIDLRPENWSTTGGGYASEETNDANLFLTGRTILRELVTVEGNDRITGNDAGNRISTRGGDDTVYGGSGDDVIELGSGDDVYHYGGGADRAFGGEGKDSLVIAGDDLGRYKLVPDEGRLLITDLLTSTVATIREFEQVSLGGQVTELEGISAQLADINQQAGLLLDAGLPLYQSAVQGDGFDIEAQSAQLYRIYYGALGRAPDEAGFTFWSQALQEGTYELEEVAGRFLSSEEFISLADRNNSGNVGAEEFVTHMYENVFAREPDEAGYDWWVDQLYSQAFDQQGAFVNMAQSDEFVLLSAQTVSDYLFI